MVVKKRKRKKVSKRVAQERKRAAEIRKGIKYYQTPQKLKERREAEKRLSEIKFYDPFADLKGEKTIVEKARRPRKKW